MLTTSAARGTLFGLIAAVCYGFIPLFTLPITHLATAGEGLSDLSIVFYRFSFSALVVGAMMLLTRRSFRLTRGELVTLTYLAFLSDGAALFLIDSYNYMSSGVATTLHFMYPVFTALLMMAFYHEARRASTLSAVAMAVVGVTVLSWPSEGAGVSLRGVIIALISAACYAMYIIRVNRSRVRDMDSMKLAFYVMFIGATIFGAEAVRQGELMPIRTSDQWTNLLLLSVICTVVTNLSLIVAVKRIGSTMTAVLGALEPLTAVVIGCLVFAEAFTASVALGISLIIPAVIIIIFTRGR